MLSRYSDKPAAAKSMPTDARIRSSVSMVSSEASSGRQRVSVRPAAMQRATSAASWNSPSKCRPAGS
ncbi:hypothetical protein Rumeso_01418 [Rubellimicrobium mesophilum DSM 19309]|uniref:Uncharacterized protein n=1 Tax=Rubellimicrobium mesophilum DSM 19309 TaxID=442562 RepID=A0A017HR96_9RHOB|nr:hypothetical protein Rumeso_01418 [Rubellimicrobium mesophilum DSM 19309]